MKFFSTIFQIHPHPSLTWDPPPRPRSVTWRLRSVTSAANDCRVEPQSWRKPQCFLDSVKVTGTLEEADTPGSRAPAGSHWVNSGRQENPGG